jgi:hypothetical protein
VWRNGLVPLPSYYPFTSLSLNLNLLRNWSGRADLNGRPLAPQASTLPGCATPRHALFNFTVARIVSLEAAGMQPVHNRCAGPLSVGMRLQHFENRPEIPPQLLREFFGTHPLV